MEEIQSTAGAIPVRNEKGEVSMQKVKVHRYITGKRPQYAPQSTSEEESDDEDFIEQRNVRGGSPMTNFNDEKMVQLPSNALDDARLRRLGGLTSRKGQKEKRPLQEPEIIKDSSSGEESDVEQNRRHRRQVSGDEKDSNDDDGDLSDSEIERRRQKLRQRVLNQTKAKEMNEVLEKEEEGHGSDDDSSDESSEYEEYSASDEDAGPRLKPIFVRKRDRVTIIQKEKEDIKQKQLEYEQKKLAEERRRATLRMVEEEIRKEQALVKANTAPTEASLEDVNTDDENDENEYEAWKLRELKRIKRDREEHDLREAEKAEIERLRNMTEEERRLELRLNPKKVTNKAAKGKYKFMQKYYHRGAFYLDEENEILKRDYSSATLEDHFDKTILPKVMQVKNFGRSGRTKYTHLVDQDTTSFDSPWVSETSQNLKFHTNQAGGMKQVFQKPTLKKQRSK
ncbi:microfibrillar-associated protein 1 [Daktulosphaira vitifoliae]|uniref:microfibrillar-associated protein 1 n=1 Tax=Daktulosphaira vitifoliae TaxID=58002 RepID=UPI0021AAACD4|nr:microfibrillar-associated protein 1 [Daktulosphaira vitifoliae]